METRNILNVEKVMALPFSDDYIYEGDLRFKDFPKTVTAGTSYCPDNLPAFEITEDVFGSTPKAKQEISLNPGMLAAIQYLHDNTATTGVQKTDKTARCFVSEYKNFKHGTFVCAYMPASGRVYSCLKDQKGRLQTFMLGGEIDRSVDPSGHYIGTDIWLCLLTCVKWAYKTMDEHWIAEFGGRDKLVRASDLVETVIRKETFETESDVKRVYKLQQFMNEIINDSRLPLMFNTPQPRPNALTEVTIACGICAPNKVLSGPGFEVLRKDGEPVRAHDSRPLKEVRKEYREKYSKLFPFDTCSQEDKKLIPDMGGMIFTREIKKALDAIVSGHTRVMILRGGAGSGKSMLTKCISYILGIPCYVQSCSSGTDEASLLASYVPVTDAEKLTERTAGAILEDLEFDPANAVRRVLGENVSDDITPARAFMMIADRLSGNSSGSFKLVRSPLVEGAVKPSVVEIAEPTLVSNPGVLPALNALLDDTAKTVIADGTTITLNPDSIFIFTTNVDYAGCRDLNEALKSRASLIIDFDDPAPEEMAQRALCGEKEKRLMAENNVNENDAMDMAVTMAKTLSKIATYVKEQMISGAVYGYREFDAWFCEWLYTKDVCAAAEDTVIPHVSSDPEVKKELREMIRTKINA